MSFGGRGAAAAPKNYVPGLGRGASGFTTRSDVGPALQAPSAAGAAGAAGPATAAVSSSRFGAAPSHYVPGAGRGAGKMGDTSGGGGGATSGSFDAFGGYLERPQAAAAAAEGQFDDDDDEADRIWDAIEQRRKNRGKKRREGDRDDNEQDEDEEGGVNATRKRIGGQFRELKQELAHVTEDQWASIPEVGDHSLKYKQQRRHETFTPLTDSLLEQRHKTNLDATSAAVSSTAVAAEDGKKTVLAVSNMSGLSAARGTVLGMSLDKMSDSVGGQTVVDPQGYLTSLSHSATQSIATADVGDVHKARLLLKSVRDTNPKHGPGWIASARVEEAAGKTLQARKIIQQACKTCPDNEDVWLEAARLHPHEVAKSILATAVRRIPTSVKIFIKAADLEQSETAKKAVLRKALEANPTSVTLWKAAIEMEDAQDARILLSVAVEKVPHSVEMWLALARLESYQNAQKVLNKARKALPAERIIWIAAAKLEESQNHQDRVDQVIHRAMQSLAKHDAVVTRDQWLKEAQAAESTGAPLTSASIVKHCIGMGVDEPDRPRTWAGDAQAALRGGSVATARAILAHALQHFPTKRDLWNQAVNLERKHGTPSTLDEVLAAASERLPQLEIFWLLRAKERWMAGEVDKAREILTSAFAANPNSESVWLAAAKLEWENSEVERARVLLQRARESAPTARVYMKSAILEREQGDYPEALRLIEDGIAKYPSFSKLYMMGGQICSEDLPKTKTQLDRARKFFERGLEACPDNVVLWTLASRLEEAVSLYDPSKTKNVGATKARSLLELARLKNPKNAALWLQAIRLERRSGNAKLAESLMAKALQECPTSGLLLAENINTAPRVEQKSKSADAIKRCPDDAMVICAVARLFQSERKYPKARKWMDRAVTLQPDWGDAWIRYYALEKAVGSTEQQQAVVTACVAADPKHGEEWQRLCKDTCRGKSIAECLEYAVAQLENTA